MDALTVIKTRRSVRVYQNKPVSREILSDLVDCARLAPSAMNQQLWEFVVVANPQTLAKMGELISHCKFLPTVGAAIAVLVKNQPFYVEDGAAATMNLLNGAAAHGLGSCWISADKQPYADAVRQLLGAGVDYKLLSVVAVGYGDETPNPEKRPLNSMLHWEKF